MSSCEQDDDGADRLPIYAGMPLAEVKRVVLLAALERNRGNKLAAAAELGVNRKTVYAMLRVFADQERRASA